MPINYTKNEKHTALGIRQIESDYLPFNKNFVAL